MDTRVTRGIAKNPDTVSGRNVNDTVAKQLIELCGKRNKLRSVDIQKIILNCVKL
jgi:hypothetical protein